jgi:hypothetical protein
MAATAIIIQALAAGGAVEFVLIGRLRKPGAWL